MSARHIAIPQTLRSDALRGTLRDSDVRDGVPRGPYGLRQRRVRARVFGEPLFEVELVAPELCAARPHVLAFTAWRQLVSAAQGIDPAMLRIHSAYRSVSLQREIWEFRLAERRAQRPDLSEPALRRAQRRWTAEPGTSAHHTGLALDLGLYDLGKRDSKRHPAYAWLARHAVRFGFYPYLPEGWHWEFNPPGLVAQIRALRDALAAGEPYAHLLRFDVTQVAPTLSPGLPSRE